MAGSKSVYPLSRIVSKKLSHEQVEWVLACCRAELETSLSWSEVKSWLANREESVRCMDSNRTYEVRFEICPDLLLPDLNDPLYLDGSPGSYISGDAMAALFARLSEVSLKVTVQLYGCYGNGSIEIDLSLSCDCTLGQWGSVPFKGLLYNLEVRARDIESNMKGLEGKILASCTRSFFLNDDGRLLAQS